MTSQTQFKPVAAWKPKQNIKLSAFQKAAKPAPKAKQTKTPQAAKPKAVVAAKKSSLSIESKELLITMMSKLLED
jgi:hypothetical protein